MTPRAAISGSVVDEYGDPVQNVRVELESASGGHDMDVFFEDRGASSDDLGMFHLIAPPAVITCTPPVFPFGQENRPEIRTDGTSAAPRTCFSLSVGKASVRRHVHVVRQ